MTKDKEKVMYTLVQHSGFGYAAKPAFRQAVEMRMLTRKDELGRVAKAGGLVFNSYGAASDAEEKENYPADVTGLYPCAKGRFSRLKIDGLAIYIPAKQTVEA